MSLVAIERGSGVLVFESESSTLLDVPGSAFESLLVEVNRGEADIRRANPGMQRALLALEVLFADQSDVRSIELLSERGEHAIVDYDTIARVKSALVEQAVEDGTAVVEMTGRLLELDLARRSFRIHGVLDDVETIAFPDLLEPSVKDALDGFVTAHFVLDPTGYRELISIEPLEGVPETRFHERRTLDQIAEEQNITPLEDIEALALPDASHVPFEDFELFLKNLRRGSEK